MVVNAQKTSAITLRDFEIPMAGIDVGGQTFVIFATDSNGANSSHPFATRSVLAVSDDDGNTYQSLYDFSTPSCAFCSGARFVNAAINNGTDGYLYFWGSEGGAGARNSPVYLARKVAAAMAQPGGMQYFTGWQGTARHQTGRHPSPTPPGYSRMSTARPPRPRIAPARWV